MSRADLRALIALLLACCAAFVLAGSLRKRTPRVQRSSLPSPVITFDQVPSGEAFVSLSAKEGEEIRFTLDGSEPDAWSTRYTSPFSPDVGRSTGRLITKPTSVQWRHPVGGFPTTVVVRARCFDEVGRAGPVTTRTLTPAPHGDLPVFALTIPEGALFDPDTGIYAIGNAIFRTGEEFVQRYPRDQKWWKYPGNFHLRGAGAERSGQLEYFPPDRKGISWSSRVRVRINGNNTRGFPQHALRLIFDEPTDWPLFGEERGRAFKRVLFRTAGNDQDHAFFRDALQHRLCTGLPFETSACVQHVLFVNGAYWGLHNLRERIDEKEIARRHGLKAKDVTIIEDRIVLYEGKEQELKTFSRFLTMAEHWDANGPSFLDSLDRRMDVEGFLTYMAAQIILANSDWPDQNVRWWRYTGDPDTVRGPRDGRWRFIMGDSDLGMGLAVPPEYDMFIHIDQHPNAPMARLLKACLRSRELTGRFGRIMDDLLRGQLSSERMAGEIHRMRDAIAHEMPTHIRRWRRPLTTAKWEQSIDALLNFAQRRPGLVKAQMGGHLAHYPVP